MMLLHIFGMNDRLDDAERMFDLALAGYEKTLGLDHVLTLDHNLGTLYTNQERLADAEKMHHRALAGKSTSTFTALCNLVAHYAEQGRLTDTKAMSMYCRALA